MTQPKPLTKPLTREELDAAVNAANQVTAVVAWPWNEVGTVDDLNDAVSELVTGDPCGLSNIGYRLVGADVPNQTVLIEVTADVDWEMLEGEELDLTGGGHGQEEG